jgi:hypothetical protein
MSTFKRNRDRDIVTEAIACSEDYCIHRGLLSNQKLKAI